MTTLDDNTLDTMNKLNDPSNQTTLDNPSQNALADDEGISIDYAAPEKQGGGSYTPQVYPGIYPFLFALEDDKPFWMNEYDTKKGEHIKEFTVSHKGTVSYTNGAGEQKESVIRFNQAGFHQWTGKDGKKFNSHGAELIRSLGIQLPPRSSRQQVEQELQQADGRTMGRGVVNWESYCKECKETVSTQPRKGQSRWPKGADGKYVTEVQCPKCGAVLAGRERITDYKLPQS
jgi:hypothetical protein